MVPPFPLDTENSFITLVVPVMLRFLARGTFLDDKPVSCLVYLWGHNEMWDVAYGRPVVASIASVPGQGPCPILGP